ncbi:MAG: T9SS type A sorting domain-containing protein [Ignavibacteriae bacterium]|nr:T9SS type A sorting domain-containing protein [Ignavibacteriota bacterium]
MPRLYKILLLVLAVFFPAHIYAQWSTDPSNNLIVGYGLNPELASDGAGGCYITYEQNLGYPRRLVLERLNRYGYKPWGSSIRILGELPEQWFAKITEDGRGGVLISYSDDSIAQIGGTFRIRVQRVDSSGNLLWGSTGVRVSLSETNQDEQAIVSDRQGGCIVAWRDTLNMIKVQRIVNNGVRAWGDSGVIVEINTQYLPRLIQTEMDKFIVAYGASLRKLDIDGNMLWGGQAVNVGFGTRSVIADNDGGVIVYDGTGSSSNILIVAQRIDSSGVFVWKNPYVVLDDSSIFNVQGNPVAINVDGGATFVWVKRVGNFNRAYTQRVRSDGSLAFSGGPIEVSAFDSAANGTWAIVTSGHDSKIYINADGRNNNSLYGQRIDSSGNRLWNTNDNVISLRQLGYVDAITDAVGGFIVVGFDQSDFGIRTQQVSVNGNLGEIILSVRESLFEIPQQLYLYQNFPNPFNPHTKIRFEIPERAHVLLNVYNLMGQEVATLVDGVKEPGRYEVIFSAEGGDASALSTGIYFYRLNAGNYTSVRKLILIK